MSNTKIHPDQPVAAAAAAVDAPEIAGEVLPD